MTIGALPNLRSFKRDLPGLICNKTHPQPVQTGNMELTKGKTSPVRSFEFQSDAGSTSARSRISSVSLDRLRASCQDPGPADAGLREGAVARKKIATYSALLSIRTLAVPIAAPRPPRC
jgi:hypothetical protein